MPGPLSIRRILADTISIWRADLLMLTALAAALELPIVVAEVALHLSPSLRDFLEGTLVVTRSVLLLLVYGSLSHHFMAGLLERVVASERHGHLRPPLAEVLGGLPWLRLIGADLALTALILVGLAAFVVPGLVALTWFAVVMPIINLERRSVPASFARSYGLVRGHSWRVAAIAIGAFVIPEVVIGVVGTLAHTGNVVLDAVAHAVPAIVMLPLAALPIVVMTFDLVALEAGVRSGERAPGSTGS